MTKGSKFTTLGLFDQPLLRFDQEDGGLLSVDRWINVWEVIKLSNERGHGLSSVDLFQVLVFSTDF